MKFTNVKQLIIKFMGGGLINFPTRFLRWVKINGDTDGSDGGGGSDSDVFFVRATIQPKYFIRNNDIEPIDIKNYTTTNKSAFFLYNKEDIISLGVSEEDLNNLNITGIDDAYNDIHEEQPTGLLMPENSFDNKIVLIDMNNRQINLYSFIESYVYKISDDIFIIIEKTISLKDK